MSSGAEFSRSSCKAFSWAPLLLAAALTQACAKDHSSPVGPAPSSDQQTQQQPLVNPTPEPSATPVVSTSPSPTPKASHSAKPSPKQSATPKPVATPKHEAHVGPATASVLDQAANGGQPGLIYLVGALVENGKPVPQVKISEEPGLGWRDTRAALRSGLTHLVASQSAADTASTTDAANDGTYVSLGCGAQDLPDVSGLKKISVPSSSSSQMLVKAQLVAICGEAPTKLAKATLFVASHVIFSDLKLAAGSSSTRLLSIVTDRLTLANENVLSLNGADGPWTSQPAPSLFLSARQIEGGGRLYIDSKGASYVKDASPAASAPPKPKSTPKPTRTH